MPISSLIVFDKTPAVEGVNSVEVASVDQCNRVKGFGERWNGLKAGELLPGENDRAVFTSVLPPLSS